MPSYLLTISEVADRLRVTRRCVEYWIAAGTAPPHFKIGKLLRFSESGLEAWLAGKLAASSSVAA